MTILTFTLLLLAGASLAGLIGSRTGLGGGGYHSIIRHGSKRYYPVGVIVPIATPIPRILYSLIGFILEKDRLYIGITMVVLPVMLISIFGGLKV
jgi:hypothetical protein